MQSNLQIPTWGKPGSTNHYLLTSILPISWSVGILSEEREEQVKIFYNCKGPIKEKEGIANCLLITVIFMDFEHHNNIYE